MPHRHLAHEARWKHTCDRQLISLRLLEQNEFQPEPPPDCPQHKIYFLLFKFLPSIQSPLKKLLWTTFMAVITEWLVVGMSTATEGCPI